MSPLWLIESQPHCAQSGTRALGSDTAHTSLEYQEHTRLGDLARVYPVLKGVIFLAVTVRW